MLLRSFPVVCTLYSWSVVCVIFAGRNRLHVMKSLTVIAVKINNFSLNKFPFLIRSAVTLNFSLYFKGIPGLNVKDLTFDATMRLYNKLDVKLYLVVNCLYESCLAVGFDDYGSECDAIRITAFLDSGQDNLTPLGRLEKYAFSENVFNRWDVFNYEACYVRWISVFWAFFFLVMPYWMFI